MSCTIGKLGEFSDAVLAALRQQGWTSTEVGDADSFVAKIGKQGFSINEYTRDVGKYFAGYEFHFPNGGVSWLRFDLSEVNHTFTPEHVYFLTVLIEESGCPIAGGGGYIVLICPSGKVALLHEQWFCLFVFQTLAAAFESIVSNDKTNRIEFPDVESYRPD